MAHPDLLVGAEHFSDAGVFRLREDLALVQTTDFFPPLVDDPFAFGQIAAANSLSDCYAMGGTPITALNIVGFPDDKLPIDLLGEILRGGAERVLKAGAVIVGGHSVRDAEIKYGLAVTGTIDPRRLVTNAGAQPGDMLVLTKPIGSGVLASVAKKGKLNDAALLHLIDVMIALNATAGAALFPCGAHASTDITGFGLLGHAAEMAEASNVTIEINAASVPLLPDAVDWAGRGYLTRAYKQTLEHLGNRLESRCVDTHLLHTLADAQTSGGLLVALPPDRVEEFCSKVRPAEPGCAVAVGRVAEKSAVRVIIR